MGLENVGCRRHQEESGPLVVGRQPRASKYIIGFRKLLRLLSGTNETIL